MGKTLRKSGFIRGNLKYMRKNMQSLLAMYAWPIAMSTDMNTPRGFNNVYDLQIKPKSKEEKDLIYKEILKKKGLKEFNYSGNTILALNQKSADRKAKNKGWL